MTIDDLRNPKRKSGFRQVGKVAGPSRGSSKTYFQAYANGGRRGDWKGPARSTAEEAAQDYIDYVAGLPPLTIEDLRNPKRKGGFDHISTVANGKGWSAMVYGGTNDKAGRAWVGPMRAKPEDAAQDYCDYVNAKRVARTATLKTAGHEYTVDERDTDPEYQAALGVIRDRTAQRKAVKQGYVYLIVEVNPGGALTYGKVGYSLNPPKRVAELQTGNPRVLRLHAMRPGTEADERALHARYTRQNVLQEWFHITKELLLEWDVQHIQNQPAAQSGGKTTKEVN